MVARAPRLALLSTLVLLQACQSFQDQLHRVSGASQAGTPAASATPAPTSVPKDEAARVNAVEAPPSASAGAENTAGSPSDGQGAGSRSGAASDHAMVQKWLVQAIDALQNGAEADAESLLDQIQHSEPGNALARKLREQIHVDPLRALGAAHFAYTVQAGDTLGTISRRFLNDPYRFYVLARYNALRIPARLAVGQVIQIPGRELDFPVSPSAAAAPLFTPSPGAAGRSAAPAVAGLQSPTPVQVPSSGQVPPPPGAPASATAQTPLSDQALQIARSSREAELCQRQQDLDCALRKWREVLKLDPGNPNALAKLERITLLRSKLGTVEGGGK